MVMASRPPRSGFVLLAALVGTCSSSFADGGASSTSVATATTTVDGLDDPVRVHDGAWRLDALSADGRALEITIPVSRRSQLEDVARPGGLRSACGGEQGLVVRPVHLARPLGDRTLVGDCEEEPPATLTCEEI
jgi:hypothetical protein